MAISGTKGQGWRAVPTQYRKASDILTSTLAAFLFSSHPTRERNQEAHLNYYTSADNRELASITAAPTFVTLQPPHHADSASKHPSP